MNDRVPIAGMTSTARPAVLVVEDEVLIRLDICDVLRNDGFLVLEAASAEDALDILRAGPPVDAVFSDYQLLGPLDGWDLHGSVTTLHPEVAFILTSAQNLRQEWQQAGVTFVPKPYCSEAVVATIRQAIGDP